MEWITMEKALELVDTYARLENLEISTAARAFMAGFFYNNHDRTTGANSYATMHEACAAAKDVATIDPLITVTPGAKLNC